MFQFLSVILQPDLLHGQFIQEMQEATAAYRMESFVKVQGKTMTVTFTIFHILLHNSRCVLSLLLPRSHLPSTQKL